MTLNKFVLALLPLSLFACTSTPQAEVSKTVEPIEITQIQKEWKLKEIDGASIPSDVVSTLHVDSKLKSTGSLGCNRFFGTAELKDNTFIINKLGTTRRLCSEEVNKVEQTVSETFTDWSQIQVSETQLILKGKTHILKYTFEL